MVFDDVVIQPPYTPESCTGRDQTSLERVRLVVRIVISLRQSAFSYARF